MTKRSAPSFTTAGGTGLLFHDQPPIHAFSGTRGLETANCARDGMPEEWLGRFTENAFNESVVVCLRRLLLTCDAHMR